jgi:hypothetical protein
MSLTPARMPITRKGRTGNTEERIWPKTVWAMSSRMITTRIPSIAETTVWGKSPQWFKKLIRVRTRTMPATRRRLATMAYSMAKKTPPKSESIATPEDF